MPGSLDSIRFDTGTRSILTYLKLAQDGKTVVGDLVHTFRNILTSANTDTLRPTGNGAFTQIGERLVARQFGRVACRQ